MKLELLKVGRLYRVRQGRKLLNLRLKEIQTTEGVGTDLYELKITVTDRRLWMLDENIGKGYVITNLSQIEDEIMPKPKENDLVKIIKGPLVKTLGSVTLYRVRSVGIDSDTKQPTVTIYGPFKNFVVWMNDVRVYEGPPVNPETLLSKESKKLGEKPNRFLPGPAVQRSKLASILKSNVKERGVLSGEERKTEEEKEQEKRQAELDKQKQEYKEQMHSTTKPSQKELYEQANEILRNGKKGKGASSQTTQNKEDSVPSSNTGKPKQGNGGKSISQASRSMDRESSTANTVSKPSSKQNSTSVGTPHISKREPKGRRQKLKDAIKKNNSSAEEGRNGWNPQTTEDEDSSDPIEETDPSAQFTETDTHQDVDTVNDSSDGSSDDVALGEIPEHLRDVKVPMNGPAIHESYFKEHIPASRERLTELKNGKLRKKTKK